VFLLLQRNLKLFEFPTIKAWEIFSIFASTFLKFYTV